MQSLSTPEASAHLVPLVERAIQAHRTGATAQAEKLCLQVLDLAPDRPGALLTLFAIRKAEGKMAAAEALIRRVVTLDPNNLAATIEYGAILIGRGATLAAEIQARNAVRVGPQNAAANNLLAMVLTEMNRPQLGEYHYRRAIELSERRDPIMLGNLASNLRNQGRMEEARTLFEEALQLAPNAVGILLNHARLEEADRNTEAAAAILDRIDAIQPNLPNTRLIRAALLGRTKRTAEAVELLEEAPGTDKPGDAASLLEKGRLLDQLGRYDEAWEAFAAAKAMARERRGQAYLDAEVAAQVQRLTRFFKADRLRSLPRANVRTDVPQPIFILGFPRSGTTLLEQTLSVHSQIAAGDELPLVHELTAIMPRLLASPLGYPEALAELWMADHREGLDNLRDYYLQKVRQMGVPVPGKAYFTDKMPLNEMHLGLIALCFPAAPLLHVVRHPLDVMVSAFSNDFTHGAFCSYALESAATHFLRVQTLVEHYRTEMLLRYKQVRYEEMVAGQERTVRDVLEFIGLPFEPDCLSFHQNRRYARTASYAQVTEPLYDRSVHRYRHYVRQLEPAIAILKPLIERLGYAVEEPAEQKAG